MKNLTTRRLVLGMLVTLVLALGVQGSADALTFSTSRSGDLQTVREDREFKISFTPQPRSASIKTGFKRTPSGSVDTNIASTTYYEDTGEAGYQAETQVTYAAAHDYDQESIAITVTPGATNAALRKVGRFDASGTTLTMYESTHANYAGAADNQKLSSSVELTLLADTPGTVGITIAGTSDGPTGFVEQVINFTVYVVEASLDVDANSVDFAGLIQGSTSADDSDDPQIDGNFTATGGTFNTNVPMRYQVSGPGRVYVAIGERKTSSTSTLDTSSAAPVFLDMNGGTNRVTVSVPSAAVEYPAIYIYGRPTLTITNGDDQEGVASGQLDEYLAVQVEDARGRTVPDLRVAFTTTGGGMFTPVPGAVYGDDREEADANTGLQATGLVIYTDSRGEAKTYYQLGTTGAQNVTATLQSRFTPSQTFEATIGTGTSRPSIAIFSGNNQRTDENGDIEDPLVVVVRMGGNLKPNEKVEFRTVKGTLSGYTEASVVPGETLVSHTAKRVYARTNGSGQAEVEYFQDPGSGSDTVTATISGDNYEREVAFAINGASVRRTPTAEDTTRDTTTTPTLSLSPSTITGNPGASGGTLIVAVRDGNGNPVPNIGVTLTLSTSGGFVSSPVVTNSSGVATPQAFILPSTDGTLTASTSVSGVSLTRSVTIDVATTTTEEEDEEEEDTVGEPTEIEIYDGDEQEGEVNRRLDEDLAVQVLDSNGNGVSFELVRFRVVEGSGRVSPTSTRTDRDGIADVSFTPRSQGTIEIEAYTGDLDPVIFTITTGEPPDAIVKISGDNQSGRPGTTLANPFVVEVVDENDDPVSGTTVAFAVTAGGGVLSATSATTNNGGRAQTILTLGDEVGDNTVTARVTGLRPVTFTAAAGATVLVDASKRAPMYWVGHESGTLHRLVDGEVEDLATTVMGVTSIAVDSANELLYFAVQTGPNKGTIRRSGLNGRNAQTLKKLTAVPMGIAVDAAGSTVYWTNSRGRIQSIAAEGSAQLTNLLSNLANPTAIALSNGHIYWGEPLGRIRRASLTGNGIKAENIATGLGEPLSLAIAKGKIYWIERDAGGGGRLQRANLDGSGIQQIKAFASGVPTSLAIDSSDNKIYWTRSTGKIQRSNLAGKFTTDIVNGLMGPGSIALGGTLPADAPVVRETTPTTPRTSTTPRTPTSYSKYDVNRDGAVNNRDSKAVAGAQGQSGAGITNPRTDVDGSGTVDVTDLILVLANLDDDVAAPAIDVDLTAMDLDFDRIQEQVEVLLSSGDRSHAAQRALMYLQHLLASARPDATVLLANYPNPFNPETWIPYHLATSTDVKINIYNSQGILVRALTLGHQSAGYYTSRSRAAYWDGRNALGERVASGIYFYQLQADEISPLRKMVILK